MPEAQKRAVLLNNRKGMKTQASIFISYRIEGSSRNCAPSM